MNEKSQGFSQKLENFWYHYKIVVLIVFFFALSGTYLAVDYITKKEPDMVFTYVGEAYGDESQFARGEEVLLPLVGDLNGDGKEKINYRILVVRPGTVGAAYDYVNKEQGFNYSFLDKNVRLYFIEKSFLEAKEVYFEPLDSLLSEEQLARGYKNAEGEVCAVPLAGARLAKTMDFDREEMYIAVKRIMDTERHDALVPIQHEKAKEVLQYIIEGDE